MVFDYDAKIYHLERNVLQIACLLSTYRCTNRVQCISELNLADTIKVRVRHGCSNVALYYSLTHFSFLFRYFLSSSLHSPFTFINQIYILYENEEVPLVTAVINMPRSELESLSEPGTASNEQSQLNGESSQF